MRTVRTVLTAQRNIELKEPYIVINENISPKLCEFLISMQNVKFDNGVYHTFYGEMKVLINNFLVYWSDIINDCLRDVDALCNTITKDVLLELIDRSVKVHEDKHDEFVKIYFPLDHDKEIIDFEDLEKKYHFFLHGMRELRQEVFDYERQEQLDQFINKHSKLGTRKKNEVFEFAHNAMALCLAEDVSIILI